MLKEPSVRSIARGRPDGLQRMQVRNALGSSSVLAWFRSEVTGNYHHMVLVLVADPLCQNLKSASNVKFSYWWLACASLHSISNDVSSDTTDVCRLSSDISWNFYSISVAIPVCKIKATNFSEIKIKSPVDKVSAEKGAGGKGLVQNLTKTSMWSLWKPFRCVYHSTNHTCAV